MPAELAKLQTALGYQFKDDHLLVLALCHRSAGASNNERLEFLGDSILNFCITEALYHLKPDATEGELSRIRASLVNGNSLAELASQFSLGDYLKLGHGERRSGGKRRKSILADALEALFGAVLLDGGHEQCRQLILAIYDSSLQNLPDAETLKDPKTRLQEYLQGRGQELPQYEVVDESGKDHQKKFVVNCHVNGTDVVSATGSSRRKAEQQAAQLMFETLQHG